MVISDFKKVIAVLTTFLFISTSVNFNLSLAYAQPMAMSLPALDINQITVNGSAASLEERFQGSEGPKGRTVIAVQDAHGIFDAQENIRAIIQQLQDQYGFELVGLEGGVGKSDHTFLRTFPDKEINQEQARKYMKRAELSGGEAAAILNPKPGIFYGIENRDLYFQNRNSFIKALELRDANLHAIDLITKKLDKQAAEIFPEKLLTFHKAYQNFKSTRMNLLDFALILQSESAAAAIPVNAYPNVLRLFEAIAKARKAGNKEAVAKAVEAETSKIEGRVLFEEMNKMTEEISARLSSPRDKECAGLLNQYARLDILRNLVSLQMTRQELKTYLSYGPVTEYPELNLAPAETFYRDAVKRDQALYDNFIAAMNREKKDRAIIVTGGFHEEGLRDRLRKENISYVFYMPRIATVTSQDDYYRVMKGKVSYNNKNGHRSSIQAILATMGLDPKLEKEFEIAYAVGALRLLSSRANLEPYAKIWQEAIIKTIKQRGETLRDPSDLIALVENAVQIATKRKTNVGDMLDKLEQSFNETLSGEARDRVNQFINNLRENNFNVEKALAVQGRSLGVENKYGDAAMKDLEKKANETPGDLALQMELARQFVRQSNSANIFKLEQLLRTRILPAGDQLPDSYRQERDQYRNYAQQILSNPQNWELEITTLAPPPNFSGSRTITRGPSGANIHPASALSPDGSMILQAGVRNVELRTAAGSLIREFHSNWGGYAISALAFSHDGKQAVTGGMEITIWNVSDGRVVERFSKPAHVGVTALAFSPDAQKIIIGTSFRTVHLWDRSNRTEILTLDEPLADPPHDSHSPVTSVALEESPEGWNIFAANQDGSAFRWTLARTEMPAVGRSLGADEEFTKIGNTFDEWINEEKPEIDAKLFGRYVDLAMRGGQEQPARERLVRMLGHLMLYPQAAEALRELNHRQSRQYVFRGEITESTLLSGHEGNVNSANFSPDGTEIVSTGGDGTVRIWDARTGNELAVLRGHEGNVNSANFSPDGTRIVSAGDDGTARVWEAMTRRELSVSRTPGWRMDFANFSPDGTRIVSVGGDGTVRVWEAMTGRELSVYWGHRNPVNSANFSPDGTKIISEDRALGVNGIRKVHVWEAMTGRELSVSWGHDGPNFSSDGTRFVFADEDGTVRVWEAMTRRELSVFRGHEGRVSPPNFSPDRTRIVSAGDDGTVRVWDARTGSELAVLRGHQGRVRSANFSGDGTKIISKGVDGTVRIWQARHRDEIPVPENAPDFSGLENQISGWMRQSTNATLLAEEDERREARTALAAEIRQAASNVLPKDKEIPDAQLFDLVFDWADAHNIEPAPVTAASLGAGETAPQPSRSSLDLARAFVRGENLFTRSEIVQALRDAMFVPGISPDEKKIFAQNFMHQYGSINPSGSERILNVLVASKSPSEAVNALGDLSNDFQGEAETAYSHQDFGNQSVSWALANDASGLSWMMLSPAEYFRPPAPRPLLNMFWKILVPMMVVVTPLMVWLTDLMNPNHPANFWKSIGPSYLIAMIGTAAFGTVTYFVEEHVANRNREARWAEARNKIENENNNVTGASLGTSDKLIRDAIVDWEKDKGDKDRILRAADVGLNYSDLIVGESIETSEVKTVLDYRRVMWRLEPHLNEWIHDAGLREQYLEFSRRLNARVQEMYERDANGQIPPARTFEVGSEVHSVQFSPDGKEVLTGNGGGIARLWDRETGTEIRRFPVGSSVSSVQFSPDGKEVLTGSADGIARLWNRETEAEIRRFGIGSSVLSVQFSPDGKEVLTGNSGGTARLWDRETGAEIRRFDVGSSVNSVQFSPDGKEVLTGSADGIAQVWNRETGAEIRRFHVDYDVDYIVNSVQFNRDGTEVLTGGLARVLDVEIAGIARLWNRETGAQIRRFPVGSRIWSAQFSPDGKEVLTGSADGIARVWNRETGAEIRRFDVGSSVNSVQFSRDGREVLTGSHDGIARLWNLPLRAEYQYLAAKYPELLLFGQEPATLPNRQAGGTSLGAAPVTFTPEELAYVTGNVLKRKDGNPVLLRPFNAEWDLMERLQGTYLPDSYPKLNLEIQNQDALVIPGYGMNGFLLAEYSGPRSVTVVDRDPVSIAWLKAIKKYWNFRPAPDKSSVGEIYISGLDYHFELEDSGKIPKNLSKDNLLKYMLGLIQQGIKAEPPTDALGKFESDKNISFQAEDINALASDPKFQAKYDFVLIPWLIGLPNGIELSEKSVTSALEEIQKVSKPGVRIMITPAESFSGFMRLPDGSTPERGFLADLLRKNGYDMDEVHTLAGDETYVIATPVKGASLGVSARDDEAIRKLRRELNQNPGDITKWSDLANVYIGAGDLDAAARVIRESGVQDLNGDQKASLRAAFLNYVRRVHQVIVDEQGNLNLLIEALPLIADLPFTGQEESKIRILRDEMIQEYPPRIIAWSVNYLLDLLDLEEVQYAIQALADINEMSEENIRNRFTIDRENLGLELTLNGTRIRNISPLRGLTKLRGLWLTGTRVSDVSALVDLKNLRELWVNGTPVPDRNIEDLFRDPKDANKIRHPEWMNLRVVAGDGREIRWEGTPENGRPVKAASLGTKERPKEEKQEQPEDYETGLTPSLSSEETASTDPNAILNTARSIVLRTAQASNRDAVRIVRNAIFVDGATPEDKMGFAQYLVGFISQDLAGEDSRFILNIVQSKTSQEASKRLAALSDEIRNESKLVYLFERFTGEFDSVEDIYPSSKAAKILSEFMLKAVPDSLEYNKIYIQRPFRRIVTTTILFSALLFGHFLMPLHYYYYHWRTVMLIVCGLFVIGSNIFDWINSEFSRLNREPDIKDVGETGEKVFFNTLRQRIWEDKEFFSNYSSWLLAQFKDVKSEEYKRAMLGEVANAYLKYPVEENKSEAKAFYNFLGKLASADNSLAQILKRYQKQLRQKFPFLGRRLFGILPAPKEKEEKLNIQLQGHTPVPPAMPLEPEKMKKPPQKAEGASLGAGETSSDVPAIPKPVQKWFGSIGENWNKFSVWARAKITRAPPEEIKLTPEEEKIRASVNPNYELIGGTPKPDRARRLREFTGLTAIAWDEKNGVYSPTDQGISFDFAGAISGQMKDMSAAAKKLARPLRVLVIGSGTGLDALTAAHQAEVNGLSAEITATDINEDAIKNTQFNMETLAGKRVQTHRVAAGRAGVEAFQKEIAGKTYDLILFNAPDATPAERLKPGETNTQMSESDLREILDASRALLAPDGVFLLRNLRGLAGRGVIPEGYVDNPPLLRLDETDHRVFTLTVKAASLGEAGGDAEMRARDRERKEAVTNIPFVSEARAMQFEHEGVDLERVGKLNEAWLAYMQMEEIYEALGRTREVTLAHEKIMTLERSPKVTWYEGIERTNLMRIITRESQGSAGLQSEGQAYFVYSDGRILRRTLGRPLETLSPMTRQRVKALAEGPDHGLLFIVHIDGQMRSVDLRTGDIRDRAPRPEIYVDYITESVDRESLFIGHENGQVRSVDLRTGEVRERVPRTGIGVARLAESMNHGSLFIVNLFGEVRSVDLKTGEMKDHAPRNRSWVVVVAESADHGSLFIRHENGQVRNIDLKTGDVRNSNREEMIHATGASLGQFQLEELDYLAYELGFHDPIVNAEAVEKSVSEKIENLDKDAIDQFSEILLKNIYAEILKQFKNKEAAIRLIVQSKHRLSEADALQVADALLNQPAFENLTGKPEIKAKLVKAFTATVQSASAEIVEAGVKAVESQRAVAVDLFSRNFPDESARKSIESIALQKLTENQKELWIPASAGMTTSDKFQIVAHIGISSPLEKGAELVVGSAFAAVPERSSLNFDVLYTKNNSERVNAMRSYIEDLRAKLPEFAAKIRMKSSDQKDLIRAFQGYQKRLAKKDQYLIFIVPDVQMVADLREAPVIVMSDEDIPEELSFVKGFVSQAAVGLAKALKLPESDDQRKKYLAYLAESGITYTKDPQTDKILFSINLQTFVQHLVDLQRAQAAIAKAA